MTADRNVDIGDWDAATADLAGADRHVARPQALTGSGTITGGSGPDRLRGTDGDDTLKGGAGADEMQGGHGNDLYFVDDSGDRVIEAADGGIDEVRTTVALAAPFENVENYTYLGSRAFQFIGTAAGNVLRADAGNDLLIGAGGSDALYGGGGDDFLDGGDDADLLDGGSGADTMRGGAGNDIYIVDSLADRILETDAADTGDLIRASISLDLGLFAGIEQAVLLGNAALDLLGSAADNRLEGNAGANHLEGGAGSDWLFGGAGDDSLDGGTGDDILFGGAGNDLYRIDSAADSVNEEAGGGIDAILCAFTFDLAGPYGQNVENLVLAAGAGAVDGAGNDAANGIFGNESDNRLDGRGGNDRLAGGAGDDRLDGGPGADLLEGGAGNDLYLVDDSGDRLLEVLAGSAGGVDTVWSSVGFSLAAFLNVENLVLTGEGDGDATGNALGNSLAGNAGANRLDGGAGDDVLSGDAGNDTLIGGAGRDRLAGGSGDDIYCLDAEDTIEESDGAGIDLVRMTAALAGLTFDLAVGFRGIENFALLGKLAGDVVGDAAANALAGNAAANRLDGGDGDDVLLGGAGKDLLQGGAGADWLDGGAGNDRLEGGDGNDVYVIDGAGDVILDSGADDRDQVRAAVSYTLAFGLEDLVLTGSLAIGGFGNAAQNSLTGNAAGNLLDGGGGADLMSGGRGNDTYVVDDPGDRVVELAGEGVDTVRSAIGFDLGGTASGVENLILTGTGDIDARGNGLANILTGNDGANRLDGAGGSDRLIGGKGDDVYVVDDAGDRVVESLANAAGGTDRVESAIAFSLAALANVEDLVLLTAAGAAAGTGNARANLIRGNDAANLLYGGAGNDRLEGGAGDDLLLGGLGDDLLAGGDGDDTAVFRGLAGDYRIGVVAGGFTLVDLKSAGGNDGTDILLGVEHLRFADRTIDLPLPEP